MPAIQVLMACSQGSLLNGSLELIEVSERDPSPTRLHDLKKMILHSGYDVRLAALEVKVSGDRHFSQLTLKSAFLS